MDWKPIETAPKDGTRVLLGRIHRVEYGYWDDVLGYWAREATAEYDNEMLEITEPTHWMSLPEPPQ